MKTAQLTLISFAATLFIIAAFPIAIFGQEDELTFQKAYDDHIFTQSVYDQNHEEYLLARSQYLQAGTLAAQLKAQSETTEMLQARDDSMITFLTALRMRLFESVGISDINRDGLFIRIDTDIFWYIDHKSRISSAGNLNDLVRDSEEASEHFEQFTELLIFEVLSTVSSGKITVLRQTMTQNLSKIKSKTSEIRSNGDLSTVKMERGIGEAENKLTRSLDKQLEAVSLIQEFQPGANRNSRQTGARIHNDIVNTLEQSLQLLRDASALTREIVKSMKTQT